MIKIRKKKKDIIKMLLLTKRVEFSLCSVFALPNAAKERNNCISKVSIKKVIMAWKKMKMKKKIFR